MLCEAPFYDFNHSILLFHCHFVVTWQAQASGENVHLRLVEKAIRDPAYESLREIPETGDLERGFEIAHALKGVTANLSLTPLFIPISEITELLRNRTEVDYRPAVESIIAKRDELLALSL